ncbi:MAG TPA: heparan-alpha-glucosaminide N-acetyltransferase domain-containing protein [Acidimicrobiia bacterium]|nr:heparan-alpha-glucosaminide N-acetyltransferase domain-containing protein [Acidimicrobiia bacterium]
MNSEAPQRLIGVDAARGLALIGMMAVHILPSRDPDNTISTAYFIASGRSSALFAVLAGVGLALAYGRTEPPKGEALRAAGTALVVRAAVIGLIGLFLGELQSGVAVILVNYGFLFLLASVFLGLRAKALLWMASLWVVAGPVLSHLLRMRLPEPGLSVPDFDMLAQPVLLFREIFLTGYYPLFSWMAYLWMGMGLGRLNMKPNALKIFFVGGALAVAAKAGSALLLGPLGGSRFVDELPIQFFGVTPTTTWWYLAVSTPHSATPFDLAHTLGTSLLVIGACLLIAGLVHWIAAAGAMTLSIYTFHVAALATGAGRDDRMSLFLIHGSVAIVFGLLWRHFVGRGPLESMTATLSQTAREVVVNHR